MALGIGTALWGVVLPVEKQNYFANPSYEFGSAGGTAIAAATIGTSSQYQQFGAWSLVVTPGVNGTAGAIAGTWAAQSGTPYTVSAYVRADTAFYTFALADGAGLNFVASGSVDFQGGGSWQRYSVTYTENSNTNRALVVRKNGGANVLPFYVDGVQVEVGNLTTFFSGDDGGGTWLGAQQASQSIRSGQYRGGGSVIALSDLGLQVDQMLGVGMPPIEDSAQSYAVTDGAQFQRQRAAQRKFTLTGKPIAGTSLTDFHVTRRTLIDAFKPDLLSTEQPIRFVYVGGQGTVAVDAYYDKGMELGNMDGPIAENVAISFNAYDPYFYAPTQQGTALPPLVNLGSVNFIARRNPLGQWGTMGANGSTVFNAPSGPITVWTLLQNPNGTIYMGGNWGTLAGTVSPYLGMYYPNTNRFGSFVGGTVSDQVVSLAQSPSGTLFVGGAFLTAAGTSAKGVARWNGAAFGTLQGGSIVAPVVYSLLYSPNGTLFIGGDFANIQGTANSRNLAMWTGAYGSLGGTVGILSTTGNIYGMAWGADNRLLYTGAFTNSKGTVGTAVGFWKDGAFGTMGAVGDGNGAWGFALAVGPNGALYEGGDFLTTSGGSALRAAVWNGVQHSALGYGLGGGVRSVLADPQTGNIYYGGAFTSAGSVASAANYAIWNGAAFIPPDILFVGGAFQYGTVRTMLLGQDRSLYIAGDFSGTTSAAAVGTIVNGGRAQAYPNLRLRNLGAGTGRIFQLVNTTTGAGIYFNYTMLPGEQALLTLQPGQRSFQSQSQGNIFGLILPGSNLATWSLQPGTNYVSFFADSGSVEASFFWTPRSWSADGGTIF